MPCLRVLFSLCLSCLLALSVSILPIRAEDSPRSVKYNLDQLEKILLGKNSSLEALYYQSESALYKLEEDRLKWGPRFRVNYNYYPKNQITEEYTVSYFEQLGEMSVVYPIMDFIFNKYYSGKEKEYLVEETQALLAARRLELLRELRYQYVEALKEKQLAVEYKKRKKLFSKWLTDVKQGYYYKQALLVEVLDIETLQLANEQALEQHRQNYFIKLTQIAQLTGLESKEWEPAPQLAPPSSLPDKKNLLNALDEHPLIRIYQIRASRDSLRQKSSSYKHIKLDAVAGYIVGEDEDGVYQSGSHLGVMFSVPLSYYDLVDYEKLSLLDEQRRWEAEAFDQKLKLKKQLEAAYIKTKGIKRKRELARRQLTYAEKKIGFLNMQMQHSLSEPENPRQQLIRAYQQRWRAQEKLLDIEHQWHTAYYELAYLSGNDRLPQPVAQKYLAPSVDEQPSVAPYALYIKNTGQLNDPEKRKFLIRFCSAKNITQVLLNIDELFFISETPLWLPKLISDLHRQRIRVWGLTAINEDVSEMITPDDPPPLLTYNRKHLISESFYGLHLHFNHTHYPGEDSGALKAELNKLLIHLKKFSEQLKGLFPPLKLGLSIPYWYDKLDIQLLADSIYYADELIVTFPEYMRVAELLEEAGDELRLGEDMGRRVWLALDCTHFYHDNRLLLEEYIELARKKSSLQIGFVIFDYQTYQAREER